MTELSDRPSQVWFRERSPVLVFLCLRFRKHATHRFVRSKLVNWTDISDVALLKRLRNSEEWLRSLCSQLLRENVACKLEEGSPRKVRIVDGTIVKEPGKTGSQWSILYSIGLPSLVCDYFAVTSTTGEGCGESLNRLPVRPHELIMADAGTAPLAGLSMFGNMVPMC